MTLKKFEVKIIVEGGSDLMHSNPNAYEEMRGRIQAAVGEAFPQVQYCSVETWGPKGYYQGDRVRMAIANTLKEKKFIDVLASAIRDLPSGA